MKKSRFDRGFYRYVQCVIIWFLVIFIVGLCAGAIYTFNERRLYFDESRALEKVQRYNAFWTSVSGDTTPPDNVVGNFASDLREFGNVDVAPSTTVEITVEETIDTSSDADTTDSGYNPLVIGSLEEFIAPINVYDEFEKQSGVNAFVGLEVGDNTVDDAGALRAGFVTDVQQALSGNTASLLHDEPIHEHEKLPWIRTDLIIRWYLLVGVVAFFLGGLHIDCNSAECNRLHYTICGWRKMKVDEIGYAIALVVFCPIMFGLWFIVALCYILGIGVYFWGNYLYHLMMGDSSEASEETTDQNDATTKLSVAIDEYRASIATELQDDDVLSSIDALERALERQTMDIE